MRKQKVLSSPLHPKDVHRGPFPIHPPLLQEQERQGAMLNLGTRTASAWRGHMVRPCCSRAGSCGRARAGAARQGGASAGPRSLRARTTVGMGCCGTGPSIRLVHGAVRCWLLPAPVPRASKGTSSIVAAAPLLEGDVQVV